MRKPYRVFVLDCFCFLFEDKSDCSARTKLTLVLAGLLDVMLAVYVVWW